MFASSRSKATIVVLFLAACMPEMGGAGHEDIWTGGKADDVTGNGPMRVYEVFSTPARAGDAFVELRNWGDSTVDLDGWHVSFDEVRLEVQRVDGRTSEVKADGIALLVDERFDLSKANLPEWLPIVTVKGDLTELLASRRIVVREPDLDLSDKADGSDAQAVEGVSIERQGWDGGFELSAIGTSPGGRNAVHDPSAIQTFFNRPTYTQEDTIAPELIRVIGTAGARLHGAFYQINNMDVVNAFVSAKQAGRDVGIVTDNDWYFKEGREGPRYQASYGALTMAGIPVQYDVTREGTPRGSALMHSKFLVVDDDAIWTGSYNLITEEDPTEPLGHADNALYIRSREINDLHEQEYQEMATLKRFGTQKKYDGRDRALLQTGHEVHVDGARVDTFFAPKYEAIDTMIREVGKAKSSIYFACFSYYQPELGQAMIERFNDGVDLRGVFYNASTGGTNSQYPPMIQAGADVRFPADGAHLFLHHKFIIIDYGTDDPVVITGSFNFSNSAAEKNDEAMYVIHDRTVADAYYAVYRSLYDPADGANKSADPALTLAINEVLSKPAAGAEPAFVEIVNTGSAAVDLSGLKLWDRQQEVNVTQLTTRRKIDPGERIALELGAKMDLAASDRLVLFDANYGVVSTFDAPQFASVGQSLSRVDLTVADREATWTRGAPSPGL